MKINPYLNFHGNCAEAFDLYAKVLGGKDLHVMTYGQMPGDQVSESDKNLVAHARFTAGNAMIMGSDSPPARYNKPQGYAVNISVDTPEEADRIFAALSEGATIGMPIAETFWARRFGMLTDRFGTHWMVNCEKQM
ncbi:MAG TPA: VOC family protein [Rhizomicrobium sp.]